MYKTADTLKMKLRNGKITELKCTHVGCLLWTGKCCECADTRPHVKHYYAYNNSYVEQVTTVGRWYYYCPGCKARHSKPHSKRTKTVTAIVYGDLHELETHEFIPGNPTTMVYNPASKKATYTYVYQKDENGLYVKVQPK